MRKLRMFAMVFSTICLGLAGFFQVEVVYAYVPNKSTDVTFTHTIDLYRAPSFSSPRVGVNTGHPIEIDHDLTIHNLQPSLDKNVNAGHGTSVNSEY
ncbi:Uncharacterised protein (plasmid) [Legionella adelaidensis]|uniref:Uncharacterized protein n=1 Tax=Legionella adelaidensis TaxID=45056 RepID=A0A0W0R5K6_9GAMM|nr:hypothetical protein [Legionella adelaidensis]KTC66314.1 hypothetical protein Lade_0972 [Legionella adelaidensis]VEH84910.1 Uncharacterised protein [Legionella adelaidensis]